MINFDVRCSMCNVFRVLGEEFIVLGEEFYVLGESFRVLGEESLD